MDMCLDNYVNTALITLRKKIGAKQSNLTGRDAK